jgi:SAM-dependent methyltransferase
MLNKMQATVVSSCPDQPNEARDPIAALFADPDSHLADILYLYFRAYKRKVIARLFMNALATWEADGIDTLYVADVGASMGFDLKYIFNLLTAGFTRPFRVPAVVSLLEGDARLIAEGQQEWAFAKRLPSLRPRYVPADLTRRLPLDDDSQHIILCSEVVEHLERPERLLAEIYRLLKPGGSAILTTDNCPSALQHLRRIPVWLSGAHTRKYTPPRKENEIAGHVVLGEVTSPIYGHINLNPTRHWEKLARRVGFQLASFGTYESMRRGGGQKTPALLALYFTTGWLVSLLPRRLGRFFGDTTVLLLRKPVTEGDR